MKLFKRIQENLDHNWSVEKSDIQALLWISKIFIFLAVFLAALLAACAVKAQSASIAPTSFTAWGVTPDMTHMSIGYKDFGVHAVAPYRVRLDKHHKPTYANMGVSYQVDLDYVKPGVLVFARPFPTASGQRFNFIIDIGYSFDIFRISYIHISNGYTADFNPGMDVISLSVHL